MYNHAVVLAAAIGVLLFSTGQKSDSSFVTDARTNVSYHGISHHGVDSFLNIPFGQDTSGSGRFAPPKPYIPAHNTIFNATVSGPDCPQQPVPFPGVNGIASNVTNISEDCLNLRITRPSSISKTSRLPVMVYIYGGGYYVGQIYDELYRPDQLVIDSVKGRTPVIYVAMNYRLGIFGFANNQVLKERRSLNVGLRDQRLALEWVRENIAVFGGDPNRVTIFGTSAGATSIILQASAFGGESKPPVQNAIAESFALGTGFTREISKGFLDALQATGCNYHDPNSELSLDCLKSLPLEALLQAEISVGAKDSVFLGLSEEVFAPVVDGDFIPAAPSALFQSRRFSHVPMMIGWNNDDGSLFTPPTIETEENMVAFLHFFFAGISNSTMRTLLELYPQAGFDGNPAANLSSEWARTSRILRDIEFTCPSLLFATHSTTRPRFTYKNRFHSVPASKQAFWRIALAKIFPSHSNHYLNSLNSQPVFLYHLNKTVIAGVLGSDGFPGRGVSHLADIPYVFDEVARFNATPADTVLAKQVSGSWSRFATSGHPSSSRGMTIKDWQAAWAPETVSRLEKARVMIIGGPYSGMSRLEGVKDALTDQRLVERCGFILSEKVLREIGL